MASLRILLSDRAADITSLPTVTATAPVLLDGNWLTAAPAGYGPVDATHPPIARSIGPAANTTPPEAPTRPRSRKLYVTGAIDAGFKAPATMTAHIAPRNGDRHQLHGRTITTFIGCTVSAPGAAGQRYADRDAAVRPRRERGDHTRALRPARNGTITLSTVGNPQPTARFAPGLIWVNGSAGDVRGLQHDARPAAVHQLPRPDRRAGDTTSPSPRMRPRPSTRA